MRHRLKRYSRVWISPHPNGRPCCLRRKRTRTWGTKTRLAAYAMRAQQMFSKLEQRWGTENFDSYSRRPDVLKFRKQMDQLVGST